MSVGLVKAAEQRVATPAGALMDALETDVPYTDVGAALIDGDGEVVGMVVGPLAGGSVATPAWLAFSVARQIAASGHAGRAWLGIAGGSVQAAAGRPAGVKVEAVQRGGAAARAGIRTGDVIESVDGRATDSMTALQAQLYTLRPGTKAVIGVRRGTHSLAAHTTLAAQPAA
jgi:putative serine protease PepD